MSDKEAYELLVKYSGEKGIVMIKEMIHVVGIETALQNMERAANNQGQVYNDEIKAWMRQAFTYLTETATSAN